MIQFSNESSKENKISNILVVGNGFDLALGLKTKFKDFFLFLSLSYFYNFYLELSPYINNSSTKEEKYNFVKAELDKCVDSECSNTGKLLKESHDKYSDFFKISFVDQNIERIKFLKEINAFMNNPFGSLLFSNITSGCFEKNNYENSNLELDNVPSCYNKKNLEQIVYKELSSLYLYESFIGYLSELLNHFDNFKVIDKWCDVETLIKDLTNLDKQQFNEKYSKTVNLEYTLIDKPQNSIIFEKGINQFVGLFKRYLSSVVTPIYKNKYESYVKKGVFRSYNSILDLYNYSDSLLSRFQSRKVYKSVTDRNDIVGLSLFKNVTTLLNYNYTTYAEETLNDVKFNFLSYKTIFQLTSVYHPNGCICNSVNNLVLGFSYKDQSSINNPNFCFFEKKYQRVIKNVPFIDLKQITSTPYNLLIFGHSCSDADSDILSSLLSSDNLNYAVVCCFDTNSLTQCFKNLYSLLDKPVLDRLLSSKIINIENLRQDSIKEIVKSDFAPANKLIFAVNDDEYYGKHQGFEE